MEPSTAGFTTLESHLLPMVGKFLSLNFFNGLLEKVAIDGLLDLTG